MKTFSEKSPFSGPARPHPRQDATTLAQGIIKDLRAGADVPFNVIAFALCALTETRALRYVRHALEFNAQARGYHIDPK